MVPNLSSFFKSQFLKQFYAPPLPHPVSLLYFLDGWSVSAGLSYVESLRQSYEDNRILIYCQRRDQHFLQQTPFLHSVLHSRWKVRHNYQARSVTEGPAPTHTHTHLFMHVPPFLNLHKKN